MSDGGQFARLFSPLRIGDRTLRNRIALAATLTNYGSGNRITSRWINFLAERAKGGAGMVITEILAVDPTALAQAAIITAFDPGNEDPSAFAGYGIPGKGEKAVDRGRNLRPGLFLEELHRIDQELQRRDDAGVIKTRSAHSRLSRTVSKTLSQVQ